jgi:hypothetical protein
MSSLSHATEVAQRAAAAVSEASKAANEARDAFAAGRSAYGVTGVTLDNLRNDIARKEMRLLQAAAANDGAQAVLVVAQAAKPGLAKFDSAHSAAVIEQERFLASALAAVEALRTQLLAAQASALKASEAYGQLDGVTRAALQLSPPALPLDGLFALPAGPTAAELVKRCAQVWEGRTLAAALADNGGATVRGGKLPRNFEGRVQDVDPGHWRRAVENI